MNFVEFINLVLIKKKSNISITKSANNGGLNRRTEEVRFNVGIACFLIVTLSSWHMSVILHLMLVEGLITVNYETTATGQRIWLEDV